MLNGREQRLGTERFSALSRCWQQLTSATHRESRRSPPFRFYASPMRSLESNAGPKSIPDAVRMLTAGVDVQGDRLEVQILGFGAFEEMWAVRFEVLPGDPAPRGVWDMLDNVLSEPYRTDTGRELRVRMTCVDSGGHHQHQVLTYCRTRIRRGVLPIKGIAGPRPIWPARSSRTKTDAKIFMVGVDTAKDAVYSRLRIGRPGPGYIHFPIGGAFDETYFAN